jgi:predicted dehydrogenase
VVATQAKQWLDTGTGTWLDVTAPDNVLFNGRLANGAVASLHVGAIPFAGSGYRMEIYGREGTLVASGEDSPQLGRVELHGATRGDKLAPMPVPDRFTITGRATPAGEATNASDTRCSRRRSATAKKPAAHVRDCGRPALPDRRHHRRRRRAAR